MREACAVAATVLSRLKEQVRPGITTYDLDQIGRDLIASFGATSACHGYQLHSRRYPAYTCLSVNEEVVHGIGSLKLILRDGDIISLDVVVEYHGYIGDNATTVAVGAIAPRTAELLKVTAAALDLGIKQATVGNRIGDISTAVQAFVEAHGFSVVREMVGHGVGCECTRAADPELRPEELRRDQAGHDARHRTDGEPRHLPGETLSDGGRSLPLTASPTPTSSTPCSRQIPGPEILTIPRAS
jgi:methionyl aminopeptidase